jgi:hypothetical protein
LDLDATGFGASSQQGLQAIEHASWLFFAYVKDTTCSSAVQQQ